MNLVSTIMSFLAPAIVSKIASSFGINSTLATKAISAIVPSLLAGIIGKSSSSAGANILSDLIGKQDPGILGNLGNLIGGSGQSALVNSGTNLLGSLLGGGATNALTGAVGKFAGIDSASSAGLAGMLAPVVLGALGKEQKDRGLDAGGLANLLAGQKDNIARAIPPGFADLLAGSGLTDSIAGNLRAVADTGSRPSTSYAQPAGPSIPWLPIGAGVAGLLGLYWLFGGSGSDTGTPPPEAAKTETNAPAAAGANLIGDATSIISGLSTTLAGVKDEASAKSALPSLNEAATKLAAMKELSAAASPEIRKSLADLIAATIPSLKPLIDAAMKVPGVEGILRTPVDNIMGSLTALSKA